MLIYFIVCFSAFLKNKKITKLGYVFPLFLRSLSPSSDRQIVRKLSVDKSNGNIIDHEKAKRTSAVCCKKPIENLPAFCNSNKNYNF
jgi:hypothetical protein